MTNDAMSIRLMHNFDLGRSTGGLGNRTSLLQSIRHLPGSDPSWNPKNDGL